MAALTLAACGSDEADSPATAAGSDQKGSAATAAANELDVVMNDFSFTVEGEAAAGPLTLNYKNEGGQFHHAILGKLDAGKGLEDVQKILEKGGDGPPPPWFDDSPTDMGLISPGESSGLVIDAEEGTYVLLCFMPTPEGEPHVAHGMAQTFEVSGQAEVAASPEVDALISLSEDGVESSNLSPGDSIVEVTNEGKAPAEFSVATFEEGMVAKDLDKWFGQGQQGVPPAQFFGGTHGIKPGSSITFVLSLDSGSYSSIASYEGGKKVNDVFGDLTVSE